MDGKDLPGTPDICWLRVHGIVPGPNTAFDPALCINREINLPEPPGIVILGAHVLKGDFVPDGPPVAADIDTNRPVSASRVGPPGKRDVAVMYDLVHVLGRDNGRADGHILNGEAVAVLGVLLADLRCVVEILLELDRCCTGLPDCPHLVQPLGAPGSDIAVYQRAQRVPVNLRKRLAVHLPCEEDLVAFDLAPRHTHYIVVDLALLEVRVGPKKLEVVSTVFESTAGFDHLFKADPRPSSGADCSFTPRRVDQLVTVAWVFVNLLDAPSA